ncbi:MAG TPA: DMT family transporter [Candidatus Limnocylindrales bacterium]
MNRTTKGIAFALATALISGVAIFVNSYAVKEITDAAVFTTLKNGVAALALIGLTVLATRGRRSLPAGARTWSGMTIVGIFGGGVAFLLFFSGLAMASAPSAAFIHKTLFVWVAMLAVPFLGERLGLIQVGALAALFGSQLLITPPTGVTWGMGETLIAAATLIWAVEIVLAKRLLARVDPLVLGVGRLGIGLIVLVGYVGITGKLGALFALDVTQWVWVVGTGALLAGYVGTWFAALRFAPASVVASVLVLGAPITATLAAVANGTLPQAQPLAGYLLALIAAGTVALVATRRPKAQALST